MKGTVFVLALLVTAELGFQPAESCFIFYDIFGRLALGSRELLFSGLDRVSATESEKTAFGKIQDCYNNGGLKAKVLDMMALFTITLSPECLSENPAAVFKDFIKGPAYLFSLLKELKNRTLSTGA